MNHTNTIPAMQATSALINISVATDHIPHYQTLNQQFVAALQSNNPAKAATITRQMKTDLQKKLMEYLPSVNSTVFPFRSRSLSVSHSSSMHIVSKLGVWDGGFEQSFQVKLPAFNQQFLEGVIKTSQYFKQESVHLIHPISVSQPHRTLALADEKGAILTPLWHFYLKAPLPMARIQQLLGKAALGGAQVSVNRKNIIIYNAPNAEEAASAETARISTQQWLSKASKLHRHLDKKELIKVSTDIVAFQSYGRTDEYSLNTYNAIAKKPVPVPAFIFNTGQNGLLNWNQHSWTLPQPLHYRLPA